MDTLLVVIHVLLTVFFLLTTILSTVQYVTVRLCDSRYESYPEKVLWYFRITKNAEDLKTQILTRSVLTIAILFIGRHFL